MIIDLLRHGEPVGGRRYRGNQDDPLTAKGWGQMRTSTQGKSWDYIATSSLSRCADFAQDLSNQQGIELEIFDSLIELGFGTWQGRTAQEIGQEVVDRFKADPIANRPAGAEKLIDFQTRVLTTFEEISAKHADKSVLIVAHAGVIRVIKSHLLNLDLEKMFTIQVESAACERFEI